LNVKVTISRLRFSHRIGNEIASFQINWFYWLMMIFVWMLS
jgi:hypothetical protein